MKKLLFTVATYAVMSSSAFGADWITGEINQGVLAEIIVKELVTQAMGGESTIRTPNTLVEITPNTAITGKQMHCWNSWVYHSDGTKTPSFQCM